MKKYIADIKIDNDPMNYSIVGYEGLKKTDLMEYVDNFAKEREMHLGDKCSLKDINDKQVGYYEVYGVDCD